MSGEGSDREILWGATFNIILTFLWVVLGFPLPNIPTDRLVTKEIPENYFTGSFRRDLKAGLATETKEAIGQYRQGPIGNPSGPSPHTIGRKRDTSTPSGDAFPAPPGADRHRHM